MSHARAQRVEVQSAWLDEIIFVPAWFRIARRSLRPKVCNLVDGMEEGSRSCSGLVITERGLAVVYKLKDWVEMCIGGLRPSILFTYTHQQGDSSMG